MMRSLFSGVSGLRVHQTKMDVIANNISNVNTVGYKSSRVTFNEVFTQTLSGASGPNPTTGKAGTNPMQIGLGSNVATIDKLMGTGAAQRTDNPMDLMISGEGFFVVRDANGQYFTRAGNVYEDEEGYLAINGLRVQGWTTEIDPVTKQPKIRKSTVQDLKLDGEKDYVTPKPTSQVDFTGNLNKNDSPIEKNMTIFDTLGNEYVIKMTFVYTGADNSDPEQPLSNWMYYFGEGEVDLTADPPEVNNIVVTATMKGNDGNTSEITIDVDGSGNPGGYLVFDSYGTLVSDRQVDITFDLGEYGLEPAAKLGVNDTLTLNFTTSFNQFGGQNTNAKGTAADGNAPGYREGLSIASDGKVYGLYSNGESKLIAQIPLAKFKNPAGLEKIGSNLFISTANSGTFDGTGEEGDIMGGVLEMANVDLGAEFTEMITTQRGYQANSRIITVSDDMLQELVNLKR